MYDDCIILVFPSAYLPKTNKQTNKHKSPWIHSQHCPKHNKTQKIKL